ncbi:MAG: biotin--[acetyl-CoA-carboxylase] ligase [Methanobrevibacter sp.]|nr:biotin--[acetyl-CoA-carboxylase] ligase [Methanobrevibacter sp.]
MSNEKSVSINEEKIANYIKKLGVEGAKNINVDEIKKELKTKYIGHDIYAFEKVDSTNAIAKFLAGTEVEEGTIVIARSQFKGKGRMGKKWESPSGGIWLSIIIYPEIDPQKASLITLCGGVAVSKAIRRLGVDARIKWPNDILINHKKIAGILTEANSNFHTLDYVVVGIGIDSNLDAGSVSKKVEDVSTTLKDELKKEVDETRLILSLLEEFEKVYEDLKNEKFNEILYNWRNLSQTIGSNVLIEQQFGKTLKGYVVGINNQGALILELNNGKLKKVISGESHMKEIEK